MIFNDIATMAKGSAFVFAFAPLEHREHAEGWSTSRRAAADGEPWLTRFERDKLARKITECGFNRMAFLTPEEAKLKYYPIKKGPPDSKRGASV